MKKRVLVSLLVSLSLLAFMSCSSRHVAEKPDTTAPTVISVSPANGATAVAITTAVTVKFSEAMNASTINNVSFQLVSVINTTTTPVPGNVTYDNSSYIATFTATPALQYNTQYNATITTNATDASGNALSASFSWSYSTIPAPGSLDTSFGTGGRVKTALGAADDTAFAVAIQQDGKIITGGYSTISATTPTIVSIPTTSTTIISISTSTTFIDYYFTIAQFLSNGTLDTEFGFTQKGWSDEIVGRARTVGLQPDGKIVAAGNSSARSTRTTITTNITTTISETTSPPTIFSNADFLIVRYNADGTIDPAFGTVIIDMGYDYDVVRSLAIQSDGKIVVAGDGNNLGSDNSVSLIARFNVDGTLDTSFATGGSIVDTSHTTSRALAVKIQSDGMIVVGGYFKDGGGPNSIYVARYDSNGAPDTSFNAGLVTATPGVDPVLTDIEILSDGKILVAGTTNGSTNADIFLMRYNADGTPDTTFGSAGTVITDDMIHGRETASRIAVQSDGKIVVSATFQPTTGTVLTTDFALFRYDAGGVLDTTFGNGYGIVITDLGSDNDDVACDVHIQKDGKLVVVGYSWNGSNYDIGIARYWP